MDLYEALDIADEVLRAKYWTLNPNKDCDEWKKIEEVQAKLKQLQKIISSNN